MSKTIIALAIAAGLTLSPVAAQAGSKAANASVSLAPLANAQILRASTHDDPDKRSGISPGVIAAIFGLSIAAIVALIGTAEENRSGGANG